MQTVSVDTATGEKLRAAGPGAMLTGPDGKLIGKVTLSPPTPEERLAFLEERLTALGGEAATNQGPWVQPDNWLTGEDLDRAVAEGPWYSPEEVMEHLRKLVK